MTPVIAFFLSLWKGALWPKPPPFHVLRRKITSPRAFLFPFPSAPAAEKLHGRVIEFRPLFLCDRTASPFPLSTEENEHVANFPPPPPFPFSTRLPTKSPRSALGGHVSRLHRNLLFDVLKIIFDSLPPGRAFFQASRKPIALVHFVRKLQIIEFFPR